MHLMSKLRESTAALPTRVLLVDRHALFRRGLVIQLSREPDIEVVGECGSDVDALALVATAAPHLVLMDVDVPSAGGLRTCAAIRRLAPAVRVVLLAPDLDEPVLSAVAAAGASGHLLRESSLDEVAATIRRVADGPVLASPRTADQGAA